MVLENLLAKIRDHRTTRKVALDRYLDPALFTLGSNGIYLWAADKALDHVSQNVDSNEGLAMAGTYAGLGIGLYLANKFAFFPARFHA